MNLVMKTCGERKTKMYLLGGKSMLTFIFTILMLVVFGKLLIFAIKAAWGITKILLYIVFLPLILIGLAVAGLIYIAIPVLIVVGIISLVKAA